MNTKDIKYWVILTGTTGLLGQTIKTELMKRGFGVIGLGRKKNNFDKISNFQYFKCDISNKEDISKLFEKINKLNIFALINNAGIQGPIGMFEENNFSHWMESIQTNFIGPVMMIKKFLKLNIDKGYIVNISGGGATKPMEYFSSYAAAKTALVRFTETLSIELKNKKIKTLAIAPGFLSSDFHKPILEGKVNLPGYIAEEIIKKFKSPDDPSFAAILISNFFNGKLDHLNGKLISAIFDKELLTEIKMSKNLGMLRRIDNQFYFEKQK